MNQEKISNFLKELRIEKGLTQTELADKFYTTSRSVSRWETGKSLPDLSILIELAEFYEVDIGELIDGERHIKDAEKESDDTLKKVAEYADKDKKQAQNKLIKNLVGQICCLLIAYWLSQMCTPEYTTSGFLYNYGIIDPNICEFLSVAFQGIFTILGTILFTSLIKLSFAILKNDNDETTIRYNKKINICCKIMIILSIFVSISAIIIYLWDVNSNIDFTNIHSNIIYTSLEFIALAFLLIVLVTAIILVWQTVFKSSKHKRRSAISYMITLLCVFIVFIVIPFGLTYNVNSYDMLHPSIDSFLDSPDIVFLGQDNVLVFKGDERATKYIVTVGDNLVLETVYPYIDLSDYLHLDDGYFTVTIKAVDETHTYADSFASYYSATSITNKVTFQDGDTIIEENVSINWGGCYTSKLTLPELTKEGYTFIGWCTEEQEYAPGDIAVICDDTVFLAQWVPQNPNIKYTITFDFLGVQTTASYCSGDIIQLPDIPSTFAWLHNSTIYTAYDNYVVKEDAVFTATKFQTTSVTIDENPFILVNLVDNYVNWTPPFEVDPAPCESTCLGSGGHEFIGWMVDNVLVYAGESYPYTRSELIFKAFFSGTCTNGAPE